MNDSSVESAKPELNLSEPMVASGEFHFSAFGPGWGFCSYAVPAGVAMQRLGAKDLSAAQLRLGFQLNRQRIAAAVAGSHARDPGRRVVLSTIYPALGHLGRLSRGCSTAQPAQSLGWFGQAAGK